MKKFSDFSKEDVLDGEKIRIDDILNREVTIIGCSIKTSKHKAGDYLTLQILMAEKKYILFTGSEILIKQIIKYKSEMPFLSTIRRIHKYYSLT